MDPEKATRAAARHLHDLYAIFGDWYLAMAAYNCGPFCVEHAVQRTGYADFWELSRLNVLPKQTANYVPLIIAMTIMAKNPKDYDLEAIDLTSPSGTTAWISMLPLTWPWSQMRRIARFQKSRNSIPRC